MLKQKLKCDETRLMVTESWNMMFSSCTIPLITRDITMLERRQYLVMNEILTVKEVAELLKTSRVQVRKMIQRGELPAIMVGREYRIPAEIIKAFITSNLQ